MTNPMDHAKVSSILGVINYSSRFIPYLAQLAKPLQALTAKNKKFGLREEHQASLEYDR